MTIPTHEEITLPVLKFLSDQKVHTTREVLKYIIEYFELNEKEKAKLVSNGSKPLINSRVRWAKYFLKKGGLIDIPQKGNISITKRGVELVNKNPDGIKIEKNADSSDSIKIKYFKKEKSPTQEDVMPIEIEERTSNIAKPESNSNDIEKKELETLYKLYNITENIEKKGIEAMDKLEGVTKDIEKKEIQTLAKLDGIIENIEKKENQASIKLDNMIDNVERKILLTLGKVDNITKEKEMTEIQSMEKVEKITDKVEEVEIQPPKQEEIKPENLEKNENLEPDEMMQIGYKSIKADMGLEILDKLRKCPYYRFEKIILTLLSSMGYGEGEVVNRSIDGRIEGFINPDRLGFDRIYFRAFKFTDDTIITTPMISDFVGSLDLNGVNKGVFITTSKFQKDFEQVVQNINKIIILIDGDKLGELMVEYNIGVKTENVYEIKKIDSDFFSDK